MKYYAINEMTILINYKNTNNTNEWTYTPSIYVIMNTNELVLGSSQIE